MKDKDIGDVWRRRKRRLLIIEELIRKLAAERADDYAGDYKLALADFGIDETEWKIDAS